MVLECDAETLASQGIFAARSLAAVAPLFTDVHHIRATTEAELLRALGDYRDQGGKPWLIVLVGHSNRNDLQLTRDRVVTWEVAARYLSPFEPKVLALLGCEAGSWLPTRVLFDSIDSLDEVYGSPAKLTQRQMPLIPLVAMLVGGGKLKADDLRIGQIVNFAMTGGVILKRTRREAKKDTPHSVVQTLVIEEIVRRVLADQGRIRSRS